MLNIICNWNSVFCVVVHNVCLAMFTFIIKALHLVTDTKHLSDYKTTDDHDHLMPYSLAVTSPSTMYSDRLVLKHINDSYACGCADCLLSLLSHTRWHSARNVLTLALLF